MAEKKFFVDINLQGSALTNAKIGTNSGIGSTEGAFGYDSASHRLQYFNGTATQNVANLSDISAVTGGLIFQGGYDPTTDTPDITDGTALKGFFWAATAAGTFLGESVQVGDSIVAKVDAAGATIADWLILQGNIVIATDSVDGISRLATQTEANTGTEGGAVVITPATLQGKLDAHVYPEIESKLSLFGGTMSGDIDMGGNRINSADRVTSTTIVTNNVGPNTGTEISVAAEFNMDSHAITNLPAPTNGGDATNKTYVDGQVATALPLAGGTMSGDITMTNNTLGAMVVTTNFLGATVGDLIRLESSLDFDDSRSIINLPAPTNGGDATNKTYVDTAASTAQANAEANASADATGKADAAQAGAEAYADSLAPNYDAAGSAAQALTDANAYTDTGLAAKLNLAGGTMSGNINMNDAGSVTGAINLSGQNLVVDTIEGNTTGTVEFTSPELDFLNTGKVTNLLAPTDGGDAANKTYVDTTAATAESNANAYTDTSIAARSYSSTILTSAWELQVDGSYTVSIAHNLGLASTYGAVINFYNDNNGESELVELAYRGINVDSFLVVSNFLPTSTMAVSIIKA